MDDNVEHERRKLQDAEVKHETGSATDGGSEDESSAEVYVVHNPLYAGGLAIRWEENVHSKTKEELPNFEVVRGTRSKTTEGLFKVLRKSQFLPYKLQGKDRDVAVLHGGSDAVSLLVQNSKWSTLLQMLESPGINIDRSHREQAASLAVAKSAWPIARRCLQMGSDLPIDILEKLTMCKENAQSLATLETMLDQLDQSSAASVEKVNLPCKATGKPLMVEAAERKNWRTCCLLAEAGADVNARDAFGRTAFSLAVNCMMDDCPELQQQAAIDAVKAFHGYGADLDVEDDNGLTPLMRYAGKGWWPWVKFAARRGATLDVISVTVTKLPVDEVTDEEDPDKPDRPCFHIDWECASSSSCETPTFHAGSSVSLASMVMLLQDFNDHILPYRHLREGERQINNICKWNKGTKQLAGHVFEAQQAATFNAEAARVGSQARAATTASLGRPTAAADVEIHVGSQVTQAQLKSGDSALRKITAPKYDGMQRVVPTDSAGQGVQHAIAADKVRSTPISQKELEKLVRQGKRGKAVLRFGRMRPLRIVGRALWTGNAVVSIAKNSSDVYNGHQSVKEAVTQVVKDVTPLGLVEGIYTWLSSTSE